MKRVLMSDKFLILYFVLLVAIPLTVRSIILLADAFDHKQPAQVQQQEQGEKPRFFLPEQK